MLATHETRDTHCCLCQIHTVHAGAIEDPFVITHRGPYNDIGIRSNGVKGIYLCTEQQEPT
jgi:hypothetical protein